MSGDSSEQTSRSNSTPSALIPPDGRPLRSGRRSFLRTAGVATAAAAGFVALKTLRPVQKHPVALLKCASYEGPLRRTIDDGLKTVGITGAVVKGRPVVIKPNLVEPHAEAQHINVHPHVIGATVEAFRALGASDVLVAEGAGHVHDSYHVLHASGLADVLVDSRAKFMDLNYADARKRPNTLGRTKMGSLYLPSPVLESGVFVSLAKMKTHHWTGATLTMKNLFGIMPGSFYGWPKNVLHQHGIERSIMDINATLVSSRGDRPHVSIVDGVVGMEGDGPIMGTAKPAGVMAFGTNPVVTDAACCRVMDIDPARIGYLAMSGGIGSVSAAAAEMRGERIEEVATRFQLLDHIEVHKYLMENARA